MGQEPSLVPEIFGQQAAGAIDDYLQIAGRTRVSELDLRRVESR
jgi:hypothetical protein